MSPRALTTLLVLSTAALAEQPLRIAVPGLQGVHLDEETRAFYSEHLAQNMRFPGVSVVTSREIATLLGVERQKQLLGCGEAATSCIAELANALGADAIVVGDVGRFDSTFQINVKVIAAADATVLAQGSRRVTGEVQALDALASLGRELSRAVLERKGRAVPLELTQPISSAAPTARSLSWIPLAAGGVGVAVGVVFVAWSRGDAAALATGTHADDEARALVSSGTQKQTAGYTAISIGAAAVAAGVGMLVFGGGSANAVALVPTRDGAHVVLTGSLP